MPDSADYYDVLGVPRDADADAIKRAFRQLARKHHPDVNPDDPDATDRFKQIGEAYAVLSDPQKRAQYDRYGRVGEGAGIGQDVDFGVFGDLGSVFEAMFGGGGGRRQRRDPHGPRPGDDLGYEVALELEEVATGVEQDISYTRLAACPECFGSGAASGSKPERCTVCEGRGEVRQTQRTLLGYTTVVTACPECHGSGEMVKNPCARCHGRGQVQQEVNRTVKIPAGVEDGMRVRVPGGGNAGSQGGADGNLWLLVEVRPHQVFERAGTDIGCEVPITFAQAALGASLAVPGILEPQQLTIPPGTQTGQGFRIAGAGLPSPRHQNVRGDQHVQVRVVTPKRLNEQQKELLRQFASAGGEPQDEALGTVGDGKPGGFLEKLLERFRPG